LRRHCTKLEHEKSGTHTTQTDYAATDNELVQVPILAHERQINQWSDSCQLIPQFSELIFNQRIVAQQLYSLVEKFKTTHEFTEAYRNEFKYWIKQSFRELMLAKASNNADTMCQAFPHHEVMGFSNQERSCRLVLDGSTHDLKSNSLIQGLVTKSCLFDVATALFQKRWCEVITSLPEFTDLAIQRLTLFIKGDHQVQLFCTTSKTSYGAVAYATSKNQIVMLGSIIKSVPNTVIDSSATKLELLSALTASKLWMSIQKVVQIQPWKVTFWTDSKNLLSLLQGDPNSYNVFVSNRLQQIHKYTKLALWKCCQNDQHSTDVIRCGLAQNLQDLTHSCIRNQIGSLM
jgi:hypothetical protein